jgi:hypothetical protein
MKFRLVEDIVMYPEIGKTYYFNYRGGIVSGVYKGSTKAWHMFDDGSRFGINVPKWTNIATCREDLEAVNAIVNRIDKDTHVPGTVHLPNRFTR